MNYDSPEEKKNQQIMAEKLKHIRHVLHEENGKEIITAAIKKLEEAHRLIAEKVKLGTATDEDMAALQQMIDISIQFKSKLEDMHLLLGHNLVIQAQAYFYHVKELAAKGDKQAQKIYNDLLPIYKEALGEGFTKPEQRN